MSKQAESALSLKIRRALNARGHRVWKNHGSRFTEKGVSDITGCCADGRFIALETKMPGKERATLSLEQKRFLASVVRSSPLAVAGVVSSVAQAIAFCETPLRAQVQPDGFVTMVDDEGLTPAERDRFLLAYLARERFILRFKHTPPPGGGWPDEPKG
jgi:hypothetical protein